MRVVSLSPPCVQSASIHFFGKPGVKPGLTSGAVAQLGERLICIQEVAGSIPTSSTSFCFNPNINALLCFNSRAPKYGPVAQLARAHP